MTDEITTENPKRDLLEWPWDQTLLNKEQNNKGILLASPQQSFCCSLDGSVDSHGEKFELLLFYLWLLRFVFLKSLVSL